MQGANVEPCGHSPEKTVAIFQIFGPFLVTKKVGARTFDFDNDNLTLDGEAHQVGSAIVA